MMGALLGVLPVIVLFLGLQRYWQSGLAAGASRANQSAARHVVSLLPVPGNVPPIFSDTIPIVRRHRKRQGSTQSGPRARDDAGHFVCDEFVAL